MALGTLYQDPRILHILSTEGHWFSSGFQRWRIRYWYELRGLGLGDWCGAQSDHAVIKFLSSFQRWLIRYCFWLTDLGSGLWNLPLKVGSKIKICIQLLFMPVLCVFVLFFVWVVFLVAFAHVFKLCWFFRSH